MSSSSSDNSAGTQADCTALRNLYSVLSGPTWRGNSTGWQPVSAKAPTGADATSCCTMPWAGIKCESDRVTVVNLTSRGISAPFPASALTKLTELKEVDLSNNKISGTLGQDFFLGLKSIEMLNVANNQLSGTIPNVLDKPFYLERLDFSQNSFSGPIPPTMCKMLNAWSLCVRKSDTPECMFWILIVLFIASSLHHNNFSGPLPKCLGEISRVREFIFNNNGFNGTIPSSFNNLVNLVKLHLENNKLVGAVPDLTKTFMRDCGLVAADGPDSNKFTCRAGGAMESDYICLVPGGLGDKLPVCGSPEDLAAQRAAAATPTPTSSSSSGAVAASSDPGNPSGLSTAGIVGIAAALVIFVLGSFVVVHVLSRRKKAKAAAEEAELKAGPPTMGPPPQYTTNATPAAYAHDVLTLPPAVAQPPPPELTQAGKPRESELYLPTTERTAATGMRIVHVDDDGPLYLPTEARRTGNEGPR
ncbi:hypothetical protein AMAG_10129 [Allomyces macrogynus ATCC 38327]|uniref:Leucine-rich repeat-containing N-terminal plant-type domain-containing protein n=1 Tax=Allomyces macrogynus (strain ATCC 38327) TaxID=578462 RepID=A0A0L0SQJ9_ALLM3|nr:hypothetical protein AMAG_10129 [Allomyces macrogynus ATCC 38327]|eukprot:KNE64786.1 hypothetical protein AMAG_10129 [Allomyces macrogynus ATCC 38327]